MTRVVVLALLISLYAGAQTMQGTSNPPTVQPVSGGLTNAELRASPVPVSGTVTANAGAGTMAVSGPLTDTQARATPLPVSLASTTVTGSVAVTGPATDAQLRATALPVSLASTTITGSVAVTGPLAQLERRLDHAKGAQTLRLFGFHCRYYVFADLFYDWHKYLIDCLSISRIIFNIANFICPRPTTPR